MSKIFILIIIAAIAATGMIYWWQKALIDIENTTPTQTLNLHQVQKDETANWQTYRNEEYGFEFKYPPSASVLVENLILEWRSDKINDLRFSVEFLEKDSAVSMERLLSEIEKNWPAWNYDHTSITLSSGIQAIKQTWMHQLLGINYFIPLDDKKNIAI